MTLVNLHFISNKLRNLAKCYLSMFMFNKYDAKGFRNVLYKAMWNIYGIP